MNLASKRWGIELIGSQVDLEAWRAMLKPPFDPFINEVEDERGEYLTLRSSAFDGIATSKEVHRAAKELFSILNVAMSMNSDCDPVTDGAVVEFVASGRPRKHHFLQAEPGSYRLRGGIAEMTLSDAHGNAIEPSPAPSKAQSWMRAAALNPEIGHALRYLEGKPSWFDLYKAYEAVKRMPNGSIPKREIERFAQTANAGIRHHPSNKNQPHKRPMELWEARMLIARWVAAAIDDFLTKSP